MTDISGPVPGEVLELVPSLEVAASLSVPVSGRVVLVLVLPSLASEEPVAAPAWLELAPSVEPHAPMVTATVPLWAASVLPRLVAVLVLLPAAALGPV